MAEKRMFAKSIVLSDAFLDMPMSARCLYFTLGMLADDEGFVGNPKSIMRQCGASNDDMNVLLAKRYVLGFESGVVVIKHWLINNFLRNDRRHETTYLEEKGTLAIDEKGAYTEKNKHGIPTDNHMVYQVDTEISIDKNRLDKNSNNIRHKYGAYKNVLLSDDEMEKLKSEFPDWKERIERVSEYCASKGKSYKNYLATIRTWARKDKPAQRGDIVPEYNEEQNPAFDAERYEEIMKRRNAK